MSNKQVVWFGLILLLLVLAVGLYLLLGRPAGKLGGEDNFGGQQTGGNGARPEEINLQLVAENLVSPLALMPAGDGSSRLFVVDQVGLVRIINADGQLIEKPFLDLRSKMVSLSSRYDERGLLGLAFHPDYKTNGRFFVYYSVPLRTGAPAGYDHASRISEFKVSVDDANLADPASEKIILQFDQPQSNHNGGQIAFGPDGLLYIPIGDGGNADDVGLGHVSGGNAQDVNQLLGKILRINVDADAPYTIPADNPFANGGGWGEIYAYGFRNPYHISFDAAGERALIAADAGQNLWEEVDLVVKGGNYGWNIKEGRHCFDPNNPDESPATCDTQGKTLIDPVAEYKNINQGQGLGAAVVGGYVYRGNAVSALKDKYIFGDWSKSFTSADGTILAADMNGSDWPFKEVKVSGKPNGRLGEFLLGFGYDADNELYVLSKTNSGPSGATGKIYKITPAQASVLNISIKNFAFSPRTATVKAGAKIRWTNQDAAPHTATAAGKFDSGRLAQGQSYEITLTEKGVYDYICAYHPQMTGTITVE